MGETIERAEMEESREESERKVRRRVENSCLRVKKVKRRTVKERIFHRREIRGQRQA